jgi:hypothetical protein
MKRLVQTNTRKNILFVIFLLILSIIVAIVSLFPVATTENESSVWINDTFQLSPHEIRRHGLGSFRGGENITLTIFSNNFFKNFSILTYNGPYFSSYTNNNINYTFTADADYYEAVFYTDSEEINVINFEMSVCSSKILYPHSWLTILAKILFFLSLGLISLITLTFALSESKAHSSELILPTLKQNHKKILLILLSVSMLIWLFLLAVNSNPLASFENWYTDHARHSYVSSLFTKTGFSIFDAPLGQLASYDNSYFKYVTWPEMPHLYPLGSIFLFLPFGLLLQNGFDPVMVYKLEIALFLVFSHVCLYFFLKYFLKKEMNLGWKLIGIYIIYVPLVVYAANGMFDAVAFLFSLSALTAFMVKRYDYFLLLVSLSITFKYQAGIFLFPLIVVGSLKLIEHNQFRDLLKNKLVMLGVVLAAVSAVTAYLSAPFLINTRPELIMNGINAFAPHSQIPWALQSFSVLLTLVVTLAFAAYMLNKNSLLSLSAFFLLFPSFTLPYFQNWYLPFIFVYILIPQRKKEVHITILWLIFMIAVLSFGGIAYNPLQIIDNLRYMLNI